MDKVIEKRMNIFSLLLPYAGLLILLAATYKLSSMWKEQVEGFYVLLLHFTPPILFALLGGLLCRKEELRQVGYTSIAIALFLLPPAIRHLGFYFGIWEQNLIIRDSSLASSLIVPGLITCGISAFFFNKTRASILLVPLIALCNNALFDLLYTQSTDMSIWAIGVFSFGLCMTFLAIFFEYKTQFRKTFWLYLFGLLNCTFALSIFGILGHKFALHISIQFPGIPHLFFAVALFLIFASALIKTRWLLLFGPPALLFHFYDFWVNHNPNAVLTGVSVLLIICGFCGAPLMNRLEKKLIPYLPKHETLTQK